jgi:hypothetical protein
MTGKTIVRYFQDNSFALSKFNGLKLDELIVCENPITKNCLIVYIKTVEDKWF